MITEDMLRDAADEVSVCIGNSVQEADSGDHMFSKQFDEKMRKLLRKSEHPVRYQLFRGIAAAVMALVILFGSILAASPEARAAVVKWVVTKADGLIHYHDTESTEPLEQKDYEMTYLPEGCVFIMKMDTGSGSTLIYQTRESRGFQFTYMIGGDLYVGTQGCTYVTTQVNGLFAEAYIAGSPDYNSCLLWRDESGEIIFLVNGPYDLEELIRMAQSVRETGE